ncbi:MAG: S-methyl-5'-thioadenosine phosphorylase [Firmicutes bacterium]|nr:S-methyl-5'-thioadenosine phosphorylase [Bacillota bacterium]
MTHQADIGIFGGSGFYEFLPDVEEVWVETPYGPPSDQIALANIDGKRVAFLPRHGKDHRFPPHKINYRANLWAMRELGVTRLIGPCAAGSLQARIKPGDFVVTDQFVNRTWGREDTFFDGPITTHISAADPYCEELRQIAISEGKKLGIPIHEKGTVVVISGPRFSTRAESRVFQSHGWEVINMTQYPEGMLARELGICYVNIALITDYDAGLEDDPSIEPVSHEAVLKVFEENNHKLKDLLYKMIAAIPLERGSHCGCADALKTARG